MVLFRIVLVQISKIAPQRNKFDAVENFLAAYFRADFVSLFARLTRLPPAHFSPPLSKRSFAYSRIFTFYGRFRQRNLPPQARTHGFAFCSGFAPFSPVSVQRGSAAGQAQAGVENTLPDCCRSAALPERGCSSGGNWHKTRRTPNGAGALLRTNLIYSNATNLILKHIFFFFLK